MPRTKLQQHLKPSVSARQKLVPSLSKSVSLLAMSQQELRDVILRVIEENPFVEEISSGGSLPFHGSEKLDHVTPARIGLQEGLLQQLSDQSLPKRIYELVRIIISTIDSNGFAQLPHRVSAVENKFSNRELKTSVEVLKELEPCGVTAENIWQSLSWQSEKRYPDDLLLIDIIDSLSQARSGLQKLSGTEKDHLAETLGVHRDKVDAKLKLLSSLDPYPIHHGVDNTTQWIIPEVFFSVHEGQVKVRLADQYLPKFKMNTALYLSLPTQKRNEWAENYRSAKALVDSLAFRTSTLSQICNLIAKKQYNYFIKGPIHIKSMSLKELAESTGRHASTVSRLLTHKYFHASWGIYPLRIFLNRKVRTVDGSERSVEDLKNAILGLLARENFSAGRMSDRAIAEILKHEGFQVERRTINKYRRSIFQGSTRER